MGFGPLPSFFVSDVASIQDQLAETLRAYVRASSSDRTLLLKRAADLTVVMRSLFTDKHGQPDWRGASYAYRNAMGEVFSLAGLTDRDTRKVVGDALRYHASISLRERVSADELNAIGLRELSTRERSIEKREKEKSEREAWRSLTKGKGPDAPETVLRGAVRLLSLLDDATIAARPDEAKAAVREHCEALAGEVRRIKRAAGVTK